MSLIKRCADTLQYGQTEDKYYAASFLIKSKVGYENLQGEKQREAYKNLIHEYCLRYNLKPQKLGKVIASGSAN